MKKGYVWDEGIPINEEEREKIFEKGFRGKSGSKISGSGIGLALQEIWLGR